jgi:hypothetical protein
MSIHIAGRVVKRDNDLMTILTYVSMVSASCRRP